MIAHELRADGSKLVHCHGCFDLSHVGHVKHLQAAKRFGSVLIVTITPDCYVNKGNNRPVFNEHLRAESVAALECVDYVAINKWPTACEAIRMLHPHIFAKGEEYRERKTAELTSEEAAVLSVGGRVEFTDGFAFSTTELIRRITA